MNRPDNPRIAAAREACARSLAAGDYRAALVAIERALAIADNDPGDHLQRGLLLAILGQRREALDAADRAVALAGDGFAADGRLGTLYSYANEPARALPAFRRALARAPADRNLLYSLAVTLRMTGDLDEARQRCEQLLIGDPRDVAALALRSELSTGTVATDHRAALRARLAIRPLDPRDEVTLRFALARECEAMGDDAEGFDQLDRGCAIQRALMRYNVEGDLQTLEAIRTYHDARALARMGDGYDGIDPIFIVGLPRTGTTLVERMLTMNESVVSIGESNAFALALVGTVRSRSDGKIGLVEAALQVDAALLGAAYNVAAAPYPRGSRYIDKMPLNYLYLGLIAQSLPRSRIVLLDRDPMDSIYAMLKSLFVGAYPFSYRLDELARYYVAWHRLIRHWEAMLGERMLTVHYETLVTDTEAEARRLLVHCSLDWSDDCLSFFDNPAASSTLSAVQVRRPMHDRSIGLWRRHADRLAPAVAVLRAEGIAVA